MFAVSGMLTVLVAALALYLASPQQKLARRPCPRPAGPVSRV